MKWCDYRNFKHYEQVEQLRDIVLAEWSEIRDTLVQEKQGMNINDRYNDGDSGTNWYGFPLIDAGTITEEYARHWPKTVEKLKTLPGIVNACINFVGPHSLVPDHVDDLYDLNQEVVGKVRAVGTIVGIHMPSTDPKVVGFHIENEMRGWGTGEIVSFDGYRNHGGWNHTDEWRVTLLFDTDIREWNTESWD